VPDGHNHFHIRAPLDDVVSYLEEEADRQIETIPYKEGTYSRVSGYPHDYEWDGWVTH
jgi:hypothetical protein